MATTRQEVLTNEMSAIPRILIADDQPDVLEALRLLLKSEGYETEAANSPGAILTALESREFDLVLMDLNYARDTTSGREGIELVAQIRGRENNPPIVVMTGWATIGLAVEAMQQGVGDFVEKPWANKRLLEILQKQIEIGRQRREAGRHAREEELQRLNTAEQARLQEREMEEALRIQRGFLPSQIAQAKGYEIAGTWQPSRVVGGDYYDVLRFDENTLAVCIADVAGKGMPAALLMSNLQAAVRGLASATLSPEELCRRINRVICGNIAEDRFISFFYGLLDSSTGRLNYVNAGHNAPILVRRNGTAERLTDGEKVLGIFPSQEYPAGETTLGAGDRLVLFTDGVPEARDANGEEFGEERLVHESIKHRKAGAETLLARLMKGVMAFGGRELEDDATLLIVARNS